MGYTLSAIALRAERLNIGYIICASAQKRHNMVRLQSSYTVATKAPVTVFVAKFLEFLLGEISLCYEPADPPCVIGVVSLTDP
jgi:hypothetical protein